jgi:hypothetical protein
MIKVMATYPIRKTITRSITKFLAAMLIFTVFVETPSANAIAPLINSLKSLSNGAANPTLIVTGVNFAADNDKFHFTVDLGTTGLRFDSLAYVDSSHVRFNFTGSAGAGTIKIQAAATAFDPVAGDVSNTLSIDIPDALINQLISFKAPSSMSVGDADQAPIASSSSFLSVETMSNTPSVCTIDFSKIHAVSAGTCLIKASQAGNSTYAAAQDVIKSFTISSAVTGASNTAPTVSPIASNLGSFQYFPDAPISSYAEIIVAPNDVLQGTPTHIQFLVPSRATDGPAVFLVSSFSSDIETTQGYFVTRISLVDKTGAAISYVAGAYEIKMPAGAFYAELYWSSDGQIWQKIPESKTEFLPMDSHAIYFHEKDGSSSILTNQLGLFGYRKAQAPLTLTSPATTLNLGAQMTLAATGGSGSAVVNFGTTTAAICSVTPGGLLTGVKEGKCLLTARKYASSNYIDTLSNTVVVEVKSTKVNTKTSSTVITSKSTCDSLSYSISNSSTSVEATLCPRDAGKTAILYVRSNSSTRKWVDKKVASAIIDENGNVTFKVTAIIGNSNFLHVFVNGEHRI